MNRFSDVRLTSTVHGYPCVHDRNQATGRGSRCPQWYRFQQDKAFADNGFDLLRNAEAAYRWRAELGSEE